MTRTTLHPDTQLDADTTPSRRAERAAKQLRRRISDRRQHDAEVAEFRQDLADYAATADAVARFTLTPRL